MRAVLSLLLVGFVVATLTIFFAIRMRSQAQWAGDLCRYGEPICDTAFFYMLIAATAVVAIFLLFWRIVDV
jgi:hypothetical protein